MPQKRRTPPATTSGVPERSNDDEILAADVLAAVSENAHDLLARTGSPDQKDWRSPAHRFVVHLRSHPALAALSPDQAADRIEPVLWRLAGGGHLRASWDAAIAEAGESTDRPPGGTSAWRQALGGLDTRGERVDPEQDFLHCWGKLQPASPFAIAFQRSEDPKWQRPDVFGAKYTAPRRAGFRRLMAYAYERSLLTPGQPFPLPVALGDQFSLATRGAFAPDRGSVWRWIEEGAKEGFLTLAVAKEKPGRHARGRAAEYLWVAAVGFQNAAVVQPNGKGCRTGQKCDSHLPQLPHTPHPPFRSPRSRADRHGGAVALRASKKVRRRRK